MTDPKGKNISWEDVYKRNPRERMKLEKHPLDIINELDQLIKTGYENLPEEDLVRLQWYGLYHDKPRIGYFMLRIKRPNGILTPLQLKTIGKLAKRFGDYAEITTRQNIQLHWIRLDDLPEVFSILRESGLTTIGGCGDTIRNITGCPVTGFDRDELFETTEYINELVSFFYNPHNRDYFNLPRKHKITLSACAYHCNYPEIHDISFVGVRKGERTGFTVWIGGGLSSNPRIAKPLGIFIEPEEVVQVARAILDCWREAPENRQSFVKARIKFFVDKIGPERYRSLIEERLGKKLEDYHEIPKPIARDFHIGLREQKQKGFFYIGFPVIAGKLNGEQILSIAELAEEENLAIRLSQRQNVILANIPKDRVNYVINRMEQLGFKLDVSPFRASSIACTSDPYCNYSLNSSKDVLLSIMDYLEERLGPLGDIVIGADGCPHACAHHWVGDIGLQASYQRKPDGSVESALMIMLGGGYGKEASISRVVAKRVPVEEAKLYLENLIRRYREEGQDKTFREFCLSYSDEELNSIMKGEKKQKEEAI
jgi:sulfite reductase beta subunit-like hemoprotein